MPIIESKTDLAKKANIIKQALIKNWWVMHFEEIGCILIKRGDEYANRTFI